MQHIHVAFFDAPFNFEKLENNGENNKNDKQAN